MTGAVPALALNSSVSVRLAHRHGEEYSTRVEDLTPDAVVVTAPTGANAALIASGTREIDLSWLSPRGRYEQRCELEHGAGTARRWRLRPLRQAILVQRRRYIRVRAAVDVSVQVGGETLPGTTIDVSEGGFRVRIPQRQVSELEPTVVHAMIGGMAVTVPGYILRTTEAGPQESEAVIAFEATGAQAEAIRRLVLHMQLRSRATRG